MWPAVTRVPISQTHGPTDQHACSPQCSSLFHLVLVAWDKLIIDDNFLNSRGLNA